jgi:DNA-binding transcriptional regulator LsrR (DeoR family)
LAYDLSKKLRAKCKYLYAPALVDNAFIKKSLVENEGIRDVLEAGKNVDFALVGIASPFSKNNTMTEIGYVDQQDIDGLETLNVIGDVNSKFIDRAGKEVPCEINENVIGLGVEDVRKIPNVAVACYEESKKDVLYVGTKTNIFTHITVTDSLAEYLLEQAKNETC